MSIASLYPSINPSLLLDFANSKVLDSRVTFTRTTTATYYDGVTTAKAEENLVLYSQEFDNAWWTKGASAGTGTSTVTANAATAPDGTSTADRWVATRGTSSWVRIVSPTISAPVGSTVMLSIYAQRVGGTNQTFYLREGQSGGVSSALTATSAWQRFTLSATVAASGLAEFNVWQDTTDCDIYIWGAQLEQRSTATAYTATTSQAITNYIPVLQTASSGQARFDHNPTTGESLGLLIEEARTNSVTYSSQFSNVAWTKTACSFTSTANVAPDGTLTAQQLVEDTSTSVRYVQSNSISFVSGTSYTSTIYVKANGRSIFFIYFDSTAFPSSGRIAWFDIANQTTQVQTGVTASITAVGNGWYRCSCTATANASASAYAFQMGIPSQTLGSVSSYTGNGFSGLFLWGAQVETGSFATSYIPTTTASATRNADAASMTGTNFSSWYNTAEGTLYAEATAKAAYALVEANNGSSNERIGLGQDPNRMYQLDAQNGTYWAISYTTAGGALLGSSNKVAGAFKTNDFAVAANGGSVTTDTNGQIGVPTLLQIGRSNLGATGEYSNSTIKKIAYYPVRVTNAQLQSLTV